MTDSTDVDRLVRDVAGWRDRDGVLSVYVGVDPSGEAAPRPSWRIAIDGELGALRARARAEGPHARRAALERRLDELAPALARLVDATQHGRGRALFARVSAGEEATVSVQTPFSTGVALGARADLLPLLAADEGAPVGLVVVGRDAVRMLETRLGEPVELARLDVEPFVADGPERKGPAAANPLHPQQVVAQRERYERHVESGHRRRLARAARRVARTATERGWEIAVVAGDPRGAEPIAASLASVGVAPELVDRGLEPLSASQVLAELAQAVTAARRRRDAALVERARDAALSGGKGSLGPTGTLAALAAGRIDHLLLDGGCSIAGAVGPDGELLPGGIAPPGVSESELVPEPSLVARLVAAALESGARVTVVDPEVAASLSDAGGVAALLRW